MKYCLAETTIAFIGAGSIAEALIRGMLQTGLTNPEQIRVVNRQHDAKLLQLAQTYRIHACHSIQEAVEAADIIFLCIKPKDIADALHTVAIHAPVDTLYVSVVAGCSIRFMHDIIMEAQSDSPIHAVPRIARTMPNTSSAVLESATAYALSPSCTDEDDLIVEKLLQAVGTVQPIDESLLNAVTGLSGSGPAYVYYLVEAMTQAGIDVGLQADVSAALVYQTLIGAAAMLRESGESPTVLRERVTSPGGTTMAGLAELAQHEVDVAIRSAVQKATIRSAEMGALVDSVTPKKHQYCKGVACDADIPY